MPTVEEAYQRYLVKVEKNLTNDNASTSRGNFVKIFNESENKYTEFHLQNRGIDDVRYIQNLLVLDKNIPYASNTFDHYNFPIPENYLDLSEVRAEATKGECSDYIYLFELRTENLNEILQDEDNKPSFEWRESCYTVNSNTISVYTDEEFQINNILLSYYRYPQQISLINPNDPESKFNELNAIEWDEKSLDRILSLAAGEFDMNQSDGRFQIQIARSQK